MDNINHILSKELGISLKQVTSVIEMLDEGNTVPFIARYRKERTGGLTDEVLRKFLRYVNLSLNFLRNLESRKEDVLRIIEEQEKLTPELKLKIEKATTLTEVEDIYRPFKAKKRTRATMAVEKGLKPLAELILLGEFNGDIVEEANKYINEEKGVKNEEEALQGAMDIISEIISDNADYRKWIRNFVQKDGIIQVKGSSEEQTTYEMYYDYKEPVRTIPSHRILAINRGEKEKILSVKVTCNDERIIDYLNKKVLKESFILSSKYLSVILFPFKTFLFK